MENYRFDKEQNDLKNKLKEYVPIDISLYSFKYISRVLLKQVGMSLIHGNYEEIFRYLRCFDPVFSDIKYIFLNSFSLISLCHQNLRVGTKLLNVDDGEIEWTVNNEKIFKTPPTLILSFITNYIMFQKYQ